MAQRTLSGFSTFNKVLAVLVIIGAINWGLVGFFQWDLVAAIFGGEVRRESSALSRLIYSLVGLAGLALAFTFPWASKRLAPGATIGTRREVHP